MKPLTDALKSMPKVLMPFVVMAGVATPVGAFFFMRRLFPDTSKWLVILGVLAVLVVLVGIGLLIYLLFAFRRRRSTQRMAADLAAEGRSGPVSMEVNAAIRANNQRFFTAVRELRKNLGISVYDLPWYIVIGDSGCGKTRLVNEGGLTFSTGKPEGYQLGTLNYNWWFTEDAIFLDMAGRLCHPKDDGDYREWEGFLNSIRKGRQGFPINGAVVCVSADHLLEDTPEKIEADANTTLERLRDVQSKLGVTFATYLVVTKCDKILGFMQFFDRAERDIAIKNQIFGWSRPGRFNEPYDPEQFGTEFGALYHRLSDLRLRRLYDEANEVDLGLAYAFPEEFRGLIDPLQIYVQTLFPLLRNPRAIKNLIFRGIYFTSATQEGGLILKHLSGRLGAEAADQFEPLDLYPNKRPHFIKDVFFRKAFPEHGLVFRNEKDVVKNRRLARTLQVGSMAAAVLILGALFFSWNQFRKVIGTPRENAVTSLNFLGPEGETSPPQALSLAGELGGNITTLEQHSLPAWLLSIGWRPTGPVNDLRRIRGRLFESEVLSAAMTDVDAALENGDILKAPKAGQSQDEALEAYIAALEEYLRLYGCERGTNRPRLSMEGLRRLTAVVTSPTSTQRTQFDRFWEEANAYFATLREARGGAPRSFAGRDDPQGTLNAAVEQLYQHARSLAEGTALNSTGAVARWLEIHRQCRRVNETYDRLLDLTDQELVTVEGARNAQAEFGKAFQEFSDSLSSSSLNSSQPLEPFAVAVRKQRAKWVDIEARLHKALEDCPADDPRINRSTLFLSKDAENRRGLDRVFFDTLKKEGLVQGDFAVGIFEEHNLSELDIPGMHPHIFQASSGDGGMIVGISLTKSATALRDWLREVALRVAAVEFQGTGEPTDQTARTWVEKLEELTAPPEENDQPAKPAEPEVFSQLGEDWHPQRLKHLIDWESRLVKGARGTVLLHAMLARLADLDPSGWGFAELAEDWRASRSSEYVIDLPREAQERPSRTRESEPRRSRGDRRARGRRPSRSTAEPEPGPGGRGGARSGGAARERYGQVPACATAEFLQDRAQEVIDLLYFLHEMAAEDGLYLRRTDTSEPLDRECELAVRDSWELYCNCYAREWSESYQHEDTRLRKVPDPQTLRGMDWSQLTRSLARELRGEVRDELEPRLEGILRAVRWGLHDAKDGDWTGPTNADLSEVDRQSRQFVRSLFVNSVAGSWRDRGFALDATEPDVVGAQRPPPWKVVAERASGAWEQLAKAIGDNPPFPTRFEPRMQGQSIEVTWGEMRRLRGGLRLNGERLTEQMVEFEEGVRQLLNKEINRILRGVQHGRFPQLSQTIGLPYRDAGDQNKLPATVDFQKFKDFLLEVRYARAYFLPLEKGLPEDDDPSYRQRRAFYAACEAWEKLLGCDEAGQESLLRFEVRWADAKADAVFGGRIANTLALHCSVFKLNLGPLTWQTSSEKKLGEIEVPTGVNKEIFATEWDWNPRVGQLRIALPWKEHAEYSRDLGECHPLALCAYLKSFGVRDPGGRVHKVLHIVEHPTPEHKGELLGQMLVFTLDRPMPEPIEPLP
jgi:hypothetical protein